VGGIERYSRKSGSADHIRQFVHNALTTPTGKCGRFGYEALNEDGSPKQHLARHKAEAWAIQVLQEDPRINIKGVAATLMEDGALATIEVTYSHIGTNDPQQVTVSYVCP
jgi:phage baseplate assembly protein W